MQVQLQSTWLQAKVYQPIGVARVCRACQQGREQEGEGGGPLSAYSLQLIRSTS